MKRKRIAAGMLAGAMLFLCACGKPNYEDMTQEELDQRLEEEGIVTIDTTPPTAPEMYTSPAEFDPAPSAPPEQAGEYESRIVSITTNMQPADTIWRNFALAPDDPENLDSFYENGSPYVSTEGKVYANDRILAIDIPSTDGAETYTFSFGYITGEYNSFLYLNPACSVAAEDRPIGYYASMENFEQGEVFSRNERIECNVPADHTKKGAGACNYWIPGQTYDILASATYESATTPGLAYYTSQPFADEYAIVNIRALDLCRSTTIAIIRLYIAKDAELGTYYLHHAENGNLLQTGATEDMSQAMIDDALAQTKAMLEEGEQYHIENYSDDSIILMEYIGKNRPYYFEVVCPIYTEDLPPVMQSYRLPRPAVAVTVCTGRYGQGPDTIYLAVYGNHLQIVAHDLPNPFDYDMCVGRLASAMQ